MRRSRQITLGALAALAGFGLAVIGLFLPYALKSMPEWVSGPLVAVGVLMVIVPLGLWICQRRRRRAEPVGVISAERETLADRLQALAYNIEEYVQARAAEAPRTPSGRSDLRQPSSVYRIRTLVAYYLRFRTAVLAALDDASAVMRFQVATRAEHELAASPGDQLEDVPALLREIAERITKAPR